MELILKFLHKNKLDRQGFTLIEMLISLMILSMIIFTIQNLINSFRNYNEFIKGDQTTEWYQFMNSLNIELADCESVITDGEIIYFNKNNESFEIVLSNQKIYIRPGHQPLIYDVNNWGLSIIDKILYIEIELLNQQYFKGRIIL